MQTVADPEIATILSKPGRYESFREQLYVRREIAALEHLWEPTCETCNECLFSTWAYTHLATVYGKST